MNLEQYISIQGCTPKVKDTNKVKYNIQPLKHRRAIIHLGSFKDTHVSSNMPTYKPSQGYSLMRWQAQPLVSNSTIALSAPLYGLQAIMEGAQAIYNYKIQK